MEDSSTTGDEEVNYQVEESRMRVGDYTVEGVTHLEKASHDDGIYKTHDAVLHGGMTIPTALVECNFDEWNSQPEALKMLARSVGGALCHASKNPEFDTRTMMHLLAAIGVGSAGFIVGDELAAVAQRACGFEARSFLGTSSDNPILEKAKYAGLVASLVTYFTAETTKDAMGISSQFVTDPKEKKMIALKMWSLETLGAQILTMLVVGGSMMLGDYLASGNTDASNPPKLMMDLLIPQTVAMGIGSAIQSYLISNKGMSPAKAWLFFAAWRLVVFRGMALGVQLGTTALFTDKFTHKNATEATTALFTGNNLTDVTAATPASTASTASTAASIVIANVVNEFVMDLINGTSYLAGKYKTSDGAEEQIMAYAKEKDIDVNKINACRLWLSQSIDTAPKSLWGKVTQFFLNRNPDSTISKAMTTPFMSSLFTTPGNEADTDFLQLQDMQKNLQSRKAEAAKAPENREEKFTTTFA